MVGEAGGRLAMGRLFTVLRTEGGAAMRGDHRPLALLKVRRIIASRTSPSQTGGLVTSSTLSLSSFKRIIKRIKPGAPPN
ncbi:hypothetical protein J6590_091975 [Homalodisca vitripennis]|nr:hypothetical protein J6590_091975 [Homalodisca vitripennis]